MKIEAIGSAAKLICRLEKLQNENGFVFRGQPNERFCLSPSALRDDVIKDRVSRFPVSHLYPDWRVSEDLKKLIFPPFPDNYFETTHVRRISDLTFYLMHYNYFLAKHVEQCPEKFDLKTTEMYKIRPPSYWCEKQTFLDLFQFGFNSSTARIGLDGEVFNYSEINEEMAAYDESLPQHYDTQTAALDFSYNPLVAIFFALKDIPQGAACASIFAYKHLKDESGNPIVLCADPPATKNLRIERQQGLFIRMRYACLYFFIHGIWPVVENFIQVNDGMFELIKLNIPISEAEELSKLLLSNGITKEFLYGD